MSIPGSASPLFFQTAAGAGGYEIERSLRFNSADSAYLNRTPTSAGNRRTYTWSGWVKKHTVGTGSYYLLAADDSPNADILGFEADSLYWNNAYSGAVTSTDKFRDPSAWYHIVFAVDSTQATDSNRVKMYANGRQITSFSSTKWPSLNREFTINDTVEQKIGRYFTTDSSNFYLADVHFIDGQALAPTDFGEPDDNGVWQPIAYTGTYGTNGFHLDFSDNSSNAALGDDSSGNSNDWTVNNLINAGGDVVRTTELSVNHASGVISQPGNAFNPTYISNYINTSTFAVTNAAWLGSYANGYAEARWIPVGGYAVTSSLRVYFGVYSNAAASSTLTVTYTDATTESSSQFTSGNNNWMTLFTASNAAGKTIQKIEISNPSTTNVQFGGFVIDDQIVETANTDTDSLLDSPTNGTQTDTGAGGEVSGNYATLNPLSTAFGGAQLINGNLEWDYVSSGNYNNILATMDVSNGKYYWEWTYETGKTGGIAGITSAPAAANQRLGREVDFGLQSATVRENGTSYGNFTGGGLAQQKTFAFAYDGPNRRVRFFIDGVEQTINSNSYYDLTSISASDKAFPAFNTNNNDVHFKVNFGQRAFAYTAPSGFKALCTTNLPDPTIADGLTAFDAKLWSGNTSVSTDITGYNFAPDFVWIKNRNSTEFHIAFDTVRGAAQYIYPSLTNGENNGGSNTLTAFNSDGFTLYDPGGWAVNATGNTYVGWAWDAGPAQGIHTQPELYTSTTLYTTAADVIANATARSGGEVITNEYVYLVTNSGGAIGDSVFSANGSLPSSWYMLLREGGSWDSYGSYNNTSDPPLFKWRQDFIPGVSIYTCANNVELHMLSGGTSPALVSVTLPTLTTTTDDGAVANTSGSIESRVRANPSAGFSIVSYTGTGANATIGHGLNAAPEFAIFKVRSTTNNWAVYHKSLGATDQIKLNQTAATSSSASFFQNTEPTSSVIYLGADSTANYSSQTMIAYCFAPVAGYSAFGSYTGNGSTDGPFIYTGFRPRWILVKGSSTSGLNWCVFDTSRDGYNGNNAGLFPNSNVAESYYVNDNEFDIYSNGFKPVASRNHINNSGTTFIYYAVAENPFKTARAR